MDISPAEANVVVQEKGTRANEVGIRVNEVGARVNEVERRVNEVGTRAKGKSRVAIDDLMIGNDRMENNDVGSSTKGKAKAVDKPKFITPTLPDPTDKVKSKQPAPNDDTTSK